MHQEHGCQAALSRDSLTHSLTRLTHSLTSESDVCASSTVSHHAKRAVQYLLTVISRDAQLSVLVVTGGVSKMKRDGEKNERGEGREQDGAESRLRAGGIVGKDPGPRADEWGCIHERTNA